MPTYEYFCEECRESSDIFQKMSDPPAEICPKCGAKKLHRRMSAGIGVIFKGSGFYCTDYKGHNASVSEGAEKKSESESAKSKSDASKSASESSKSESSSPKPTTSESSASGKSAGYSVAK